MGPSRAGGYARISRRSQAFARRHSRLIVVMDTASDRPEVDSNYHKGKSSGAVCDIIAPPENEPWFEEFNSNLYFSDIGEFRALVHFVRSSNRETREFDLTGWREIGFGESSIFADPLFEDPEAGDFRLKSDSPAFDVGFVEFPLDRFGPV